MSNMQYWWKRDFEDYYERYCYGPCDCDYFET